MPNITAASSSYDNIARARKGDINSQRVAFRHFNNYVKKVIIQYALDIAAPLTYPVNEAAVLDLASGRGGDLGKWLFMQSPPFGDGRFSNDIVRIGCYDCYDISPECIREANSRFQETLSKRANLTCRASFTVADCFSADFLSRTLPGSPYFGHYHIISIQFAFHYACHSRESMRRLLQAVSAALVPSGILIITTVDEHALATRVRANALENSLFRIRFDNPPEFEERESGEFLLKAGTEYHFKLEGFVDCPEYVVPRTDVLVEAAAVKLFLCENMSRPFEEFIPAYASDPRKNKGNMLSDVEIELVTLYMTLCFQKAGPSDTY